MTLEPLLALQERDLALDRLRHRRDALPERDQLHAAEARTALLEHDGEARRAELADASRRVRSFEDEAQSLAEQAVAVERKLYSGQVVSPRELQALQADVEQLRRHQRTVEERALEAMEEREPIDAAVAALDADIAECEAAVASARSLVATLEAEIDEAIGVEAKARAEIASSISDALVAEYERCRAKGRGTGAARLVGNTCQGCRLTIPATEVDRIRHGGGDAISFCDNCGCILVP